MLNIVIDNIDNKTLGFPRATIFGEGGIRTPGPGISRSTP